MTCVAAALKLALPPFELLSVFLLSSEPPPHAAVSPNVNAAVAATITFVLPATKTPTSSNGDLAGGRRDSCDGTASDPRNVVNEPSGPARRGDRRRTG